MLLAINVQLISNLGEVCLGDIDEEEPEQPFHVYL